MNLSNFMKPALIGVAMLCSFASNGQGIKNFFNIYEQGLQTIPLGALPMQYNSSFAGESDGARLNSVLTAQGENHYYRKSYSIGYHASYDQFIPFLRSGIGISVNKGTEMVSVKEVDYLNEWISNTNSVTLAIAPKFSIKGKYTLSPSIDFSYGQGKVKANHPKENLSYMDKFRGKHVWLESRLGLLFNTNKYYIGYTAYIMDQGFHDKQRTSLPQHRYISSLQAGYTFQRDSESKFSFTPQLVFIFGKRDRWGEEDYFQLFLPNFTFRYDKYIAGINNTGLHLGWQTEKLRIMVSSNPYHFYHLSNSFNGNISLRYIFKD